MTCFTPECGPGPEQIPHGRRSRLLGSVFCSNRASSASPTATTSQEAVKLNKIHAVSTIDSVPVPPQANARRTYTPRYAKRDALLTLTPTNGPGAIKNAKEILQRSFYPEEPERWSSYGGSFPEMRQASVSRHPNTDLHKTKMEAERNFNSLDAVMAEAFSEDFESAYDRVSVHIRRHSTTTSRPQSLFDRGRSPEDQRNYSRPFAFSATNHRGSSAGPANKGRDRVEYFSRKSMPDLRARNESVARMNAELPVCPSMPDLGACYAFMPSSTGRTPPPPVPSIPTEFIKRTCKAGPSSERKDSKNQYGSEPCSSATATGSEDSAPRVFTESSRQTSKSQLTSVAGTAEESVLQEHLAADRGSKDESEDGSDDDDQTVYDTASEGDEDEMF